VDILGQEILSTLIISVRIENGGLFNKEIAHRWTFHLLIEHSIVNICQKAVPHDWDFAGSFVLGSQRDTGVCPVAYRIGRPAVFHN